MTLWDSEPTFTKFAEWPLAVVREIEALRTGRTDEELIAELIGVREYVDFFIRELKKEGT